MLRRFRFFFKTKPTITEQSLGVQNLNASRPSEHPPVRGENLKKFRCDHNGLQIQTSPWHLNGFPDGSNIGSTE